MLRPESLPGPPLSCAATAARSLGSIPQRCAAWTIAAPYATSRLMRVRRSRGIPRSSSGWTAPSSLLIVSGGGGSIGKRLLAVGTGLEGADPLKPPSIPPTAAPIGPPVKSPPIAPPIAPRRLKPMRLPFVVGVYARADRDGRPGRLGAYR